MAEKVYRKVIRLKVKGWRFKKTGFKESRVLGVEGKRKAKKRIKGKG